MRKLFAFLSLLLSLLLNFSLLSQEVCNLSNGITLLLEERRDIPVVHIQVWVRAGSIYERDYYGSGISHFVEHMIFKGAETQPVGEVAREITQLGGEIGAYTSFDHTAYWVNVPSDAWEEALKILGEALLHPSFEEKEVEKERKVILREMDMDEDDPERILTHYFFENFFLSHPYRYPVIGKREIFLRLKRSDLFDYHRKTYIPSNILLSLIHISEPTRPY